MASDHFMAVGLDQFIIDQDDEDCPEVGIHLAAWRGDINQLNELLTFHKEHIQVKCNLSLSPLYLAKYVHDI